MIIYYELKDFEMLPYAIINTTKYLKSTRKMYRTEMALLAAMRKLENDEAKKEKQILEKLRSTFEELFTKCQVWSFKTIWTKIYPGKNLRDFVVF